MILANQIELPEGKFVPVALRLSNKLHPEKLIVPPLHEDLPAFYVEIYCYMSPETSE